MASDDFEPVMARVESALDFRFTSRRDLLRRALTSGAFAANHPAGEMQHHGRLAFLGDAVLYLLVTEDELRRAPRQAAGGRVAQGSLTEARKARVSDEHLANVARDLGITLPTRPGQADDNGQGETGRLATAMEAIVGALYEETGRDLSRTADIILPVLARAE